MITAFLLSLYKQWSGDERGVAAIEAALVFPLMLILMLGVYDIGNAVLVNQKTVRASQVTADLITRDANVDATMIDEAVMAGELALYPSNNIDSYGVDIVSIRFDDSANPQIEWRETRNMAPNDNVLARVVPLADAGRGVVVVTVEYQYRPVFTGFHMGDFDIGLMPMQEVAFARGRKSPVVGRI